MSDQKYLRKVSLVVATVSGQGIDISQLHFKFNIRQGDMQTPNSATLRVYNLKEETAQKIQKEFTRVTLQVGYEGSNFGTIFDGTIVQVRRGRENATDTYTDIVAADGDETLNFAVVNTAIAAGSTFKDRIDALTKAMGVQQSHIADLPASAAPRGRTYYGMARDHMRCAALSTDTKWSVQNGQLLMIPLEGYLPGEAVVLTSNSGMIGLPEQTQDGIKVRCLIDPKIRIGSRVKIDNRSIQQALLNIGLQGSTTNPWLPSIKDDGLYRVVVNEMEGDTRGDAWYCDLICIAMNEAVTPSLFKKGYS